jgi:biotin-(acetyl-CoA carboxylase) ligase
MAAPQERLFSRLPMLSFSKLPSCLTILSSTIFIGRVGRQPSIGLLFCNAFVTAAPVPQTFSRKSSTDAASATDMASNNEITLGRYSYRSKHSQDESLWLYHVESTISTMDEAKLLVENKFVDEKNVQCDSDIHTSLDGPDKPKSFIISATSQSNGRGTSKRKWESAQTGNALFTIGIQQSAWMDDLKLRNYGKMVPLTLLPLKVGSIVASHVQKFLFDCAKDEHIPRVAVKWPNDVLLYNEESASHEKVAGILIESSQDWFLIGIGINVGYAPNIPSEGVDYGRNATALHKYCPRDTCSKDLNWVDEATQLGRAVAFDLHSWFYPSSSSSSTQIGDDILNEWRSFVDWNMELVLRDTPNREKVALKEVLEDGRVVVQEIATGLKQTLVSDYFL